MTAWISAMFDDNRIEILSDGAAYWPDGRVAALVSKVDPIDGFNAAQMTRGDSEMGNLVSGVVSDVFSASETFDQAIETFRQAMRGQPAWERPLQLAIWGLSETSGPSAYWFATGGADAWVLHRTARGMMLGEAVDWPASWTASGTLADKAVFLMQGLRKEPHKGHDPSRDLSRHPIIGGHIDLTSITADGVVQRRIHTWPKDTIGKILAWDPSIEDVASQTAYAAGAAIVASARQHVPPMSRHQRRAMDRQQKRRKSA